MKLGINFLEHRLQSIFKIILEREPGDRRMSTFVYMVRHGDSPKEGEERTRVLTEKGRRDAERVTAILMAEEIDVVVSSPYLRSIQTVEMVAQSIGKEVLIYEDLKERRFSSADTRISDGELLPLLERSFQDPNYALAGGESNADCQARAVKVLREVLDTNEGRRIAIGSHGAVMTLMMKYFDEKYGLDFLLSTTKPDIYRMEFEGRELLDVQKLWEGREEK